VQPQIISSPRQGTASKLASRQSPVTRTSHADSAPSDKDSCTIVAKQNPDEYRTVPWLKQNRSCQVTPAASQSTVPTPLVHRHKVLILFSGPADTEHGIDTYLQRLGNYDVIMVDTLNDTQDWNDLSADQSWEHWLSLLHTFEFLIMEPVCSSFSPARRNALSQYDSGPRPLRSPSEPYGLKSPAPPFSESELKQIKLGNLYGQKSLLLARAATALGISSAIEAPAIIYDEQASIFMFDEADDLMDLGAFDIRLDQCMFGAPSTKPTCFRVCLPNHGLDTQQQWASIAQLCTHGVPGQLAHPPLKGKTKTAFRTSAAQVYPPKLNETLATMVHNTIQARPPRPEPTPAPRTRATVSPIEVKLSISPTGRRSLGQRSKAQWENEQALGGLRSPAASLLTLPTAIINGHKLGTCLRSLVESWNLPVIQSAADLHDHLFTETQLAAAMNVLYGHFEVPPWQHSVSPVRGDILHGLASYLGDPDAEIAKWFHAGQGTPMGIEHTMPHTGVFPQVPDDRAPPDNLQEYEEDWSNYRSAESEPQVVADLLSEMQANGWSTQHDTHADLKASLQGQDPVFSKLGLISKEREDGTWKHRLIWDLLRSRVNESSTQSERIILPRVIDLVNDLLDLSTLVEPAEDVWVFIIDIKNAFHLLPLIANEKRYFCTAAFGKFQSYEVVLFGPKAAPSSWGRFGALISRLTQAVMGNTRARLQLYVDDPAIGIRGTKSCRSTSVHTIVLLWTLIKLPLAWNKAQYGPCVHWIGAKVDVEKDVVKTSITEAKLTKALIMGDSLVAKYSGTRRELASYAGTLTHFAGIVPTLWPFIRPLWAVLYDYTPNSLPATQFHTSRIATVARWFTIFLSQPERLLSRRYNLATPTLASNCWLRISCDASPWGMGGVRWDHSWSPVEYFHAPISEEDVKHLKVIIGDSASMPILEALAILIAIRLWGEQKEIAFAIRSDAQGAIQALANLRSGNSGVNRIAAELALDIVDKQFAPLRITHIPGVSNVLPDFLSRLLQPGANASNISELAKAKCIETPIRDLAWWRTLSLES